MKEWERRVWTSDNLTAFVIVLATAAIGGAVILVGWVVNLFGGFDAVKALWR